MMTDETRTVSSLFRLMADPNDVFAWERLVARHQERIQGWCRRWGAQAADAEDISQMILCKLLEQISSFQYDPSKGKFRSWLKTIARNTWLNVRQRPQLALLTEESCEDYVDLFQEIWERELFHEALSRVSPLLDEQTWRTFELYVLEGRTAEEVSRLTGKSKSAIYMVKYRVTSMLTGEIERLNGG